MPFANDITDLWLKCWTLSNPLEGCHCQRSVRSWPHRCFWKKPGDSLLSGKAWSNGIDENGKREIVASAKLADTTIGRCCIRKRQYTDQCYVPRVVSLTLTNTVEY